MINAGRRATDAFTLRRCQILLASACHQTAGAIAKQLQCSDQAVRNVIHTFNREGLAVLQAGSSIPKRLPHTAFPPAAQEQLRVLIRRSPRVFGKQQSQWSLDLLAEVCFTQGITTRQVSGEAVRATLARMGIVWKRAKQWIRSPDPAYTPKKSDATG
ncbi:MAG TPA: helix-turn-helix domain-containing protein [Roseiflexaceae bacterium]|nr:helix-turn-helix domain-containing protein [Roseiflexaceae bacterium]